jgi:hypothetical protein
LSQLSKIEAAEIEICEQVLDTKTTLAYAKQIAATPDIVSLTFESNIIQDESAVASLF